MAPDDTKGAPFNNPFAQLASRREALPPGDPPPIRDDPAARAPARAVVRRERAGRGGKEVTVVEHLGLPQEELAAWCKALKGALGCGGSVEEGHLVLQGDQRERLPPLLHQRGVRKVTVG